MRLTDEQLQIVDASRDEACLVVEAGAGTGKTTTLVAIAQSRPQQKGLLTVFNRLMAKTTSPRLAGTSCSARTLHSVAYGSDAAEPFRRNDGRRLASMLPSRAAAKAVGLDQGLVQIGDVDLSPFDTGDLLKDWVTRFCQSADEVIGSQHFPRGTLLEALSVENFRKANSNPAWFNLVVEDVSRNLFKASQKLWDLMSDPDGSFLSSHDVYVKLFALSRPRFDLDYMVLDEAQDANPVMLQILEGAKDQGVQIILVGDSHQQMYSWRGAVDAMRKIHASRRLQLTQSFRFGPAVSLVANGILREMIGSPFRIQGVGGPSSVVGSMPRPDAVICRTNATAITGAISGRDYGLRTGLCMDKDAILKEIDALEDLRLTGRCTLRRFLKFQSYDELMMAVGSGDAPDIKVLVDLIDKLGVPGTKEAVAQIAVGKDQKQIENAGLDTLYLTAHAAKGLEFDAVLLSDDFKGKSKEGDLPAPEEANILYVAVTRAKSALCMGESKAAKDLMEMGAVPTTHLHQTHVRQAKAATPSAAAAVAGVQVHRSGRQEPDSPQKRVKRVETAQPATATTMPVRQAAQWDESQEQKAWEMWHSGQALDDISRAIGKSSTVVLMRLSRMVGCSVNDLVVESVRREMGVSSGEMHAKNNELSRLRRAQTSLF